MIFLIFAADSALLNVPPVHPSLFTHDRLRRHRFRDRQRTAQQRVQRGRGGGARRCHHRHVLQPHQARTRLLRLVLPARARSLARGHRQRSRVPRGMAAD